MVDIEGLGSTGLFSRKSKVHELTKDVHMLQYWSNICIFETDGGVLIYDIGFEFYGPQILEELRKITDKPVRYIIYGHGHADHAFGAQAIINEAAERAYPRPIIIAHRNLPLRFDRYRHMLAYHAHINSIQFEIPDNLPGFVQNYIYPDLTYDYSMQLQLGSRTFLLNHNMGETDDTTWMWAPETKIAAVSDLWVWSCPNVGNPFKVQRYEIEWAQGLEAIAGREPDFLLPGHGPPITGRKEIINACTTVARALRFLHDQVVHMLNQGKWQEEILHTFEWPDEFQKSPYLQSIYGHPYFIVKAILRRYHGWYDGNPSHLFPTRSTDIAKEIVGLLGDPKKLLDRARVLKEGGEQQLALHLVDLVVESGSGDQYEEALKLKIDLLNALAECEPSLIARNIFKTGARRVGKK
ncbi:MAG: MBL fold metallo-hydrolase [Desulfobacteraceae bacterium]|nr:MBL fold metallo-hydrolase [Desulfobacteraceae bacterium]